MCNGSQSAWCGLRKALHHIVLHPSAPIAAAPAHLASCEAPGEKVTLARLLPIRKPALPPILLAASIQARQSITVVGKGLRHRQLGNPICSNRGIVVVGYHETVLVQELFRN